MEHNFLLTKIIATLLVILPTTIMAMPFSEMFPQYADIGEEFVTDLERLDYKQGVIVVGQNLATFDIPEDYYFLDAKDAKIVLEEFWGNPEFVDTLGMIFPADVTPLHDFIWGLEISFDDIGYVSDEDAADYDYGEMLTQMRDDVRDENVWRSENNYPTVQLLGWADTPEYDAVERKLYWAKELEFEGDDTNTLNYNIRALGRKGVLVMNFIAPMPLLEDVQAAVPDILNMSDFTEGNRYADFNPSIDKVAAVGIGGLIAGKVMAKTGLFIVLLAFLKKGAFLLIIPVMWLVNKVKGNKNT